MIVEATAAIVVLAAAAAVVPRQLARRSRLAARVAPDPGVAPVTVDELVSRLQALDGDESPYSVSVEGERVTVTWQLHGIPWATLLFRRKLRRTQALELAARDGAVLARQRDGKVAWETHAATWMPKAIVTWGAYGPPAAPPADAPPPPAPTADSPREAEPLVLAVRQCVLAAGHRWQPVVDLPA